ncbi:MAG: rod shape-determining protein [Ruminococcaceae bacterium]|nr:rod shape-determining protein [Oscillospiraceae bacterium]
MQFFSNDLGIDLGTSNVRIYVEGEGIKVKEPSVVAFSKTTGKILQVGSAARNMLGRTPGNIVAMYPLKGGVISDHEMTVRMLEDLFHKVSKSSIFRPKPRVVITVPSGVTEVEERTVINAAIEAGARRVYLIEEPLAAALGAGLDLSGNTGHLVIDIGGGTTNIAVLTQNAVASSASVAIGGDDFDDAIAHYVRSKHQTVIGKSTAEEIKNQIGSVIGRPEVLTMKVHGRDVTTGAPKDTNLNSNELIRPLTHLANMIADQVLSLLDETSPELVGDIAGNGIVLTGGGSQLWGMDQFLMNRTKVRCSLADDPDTCAARGCGMSLAWINHMNEGPINIARKRLLNIR